MKNATLTITEILENLKKDFVAPHQLHLLFGECPITVHSNSEVLLKDLEFYYRDFIVSSGTPQIQVVAIEAPEPQFGVDYIIKQPDPGKTKIKEEYADLPDGRIVRKRLTGMHFIFGGGNHWAVGPSIKNSNQVINFVNNRYIQWLVDRGYLLAHAAGIEWNGRGLALAGFSGMGKSTLALHILSRGGNFVSNDRLLIKKNLDGLQMHGVAKLPRINPGTALNNLNLENVMSEKDKNLFRTLPPDKLWSLEHKYDVFLDQCFGKNRFVLESHMNCLVILNWDRKNNQMEYQQVNLAERVDLLQAFMKSLGLFYENEDSLEIHKQGPSDYLEHLNGCMVMEFRGGVDFYKAADVCIDILENSFS